MSDALAKTIASIRDLEAIGLADRLELIVALEGVEAEVARLKAVVALVLRHGTGIQRSVQCMLEVLNAAREAAEAAKAQANP